MSNLSLVKELREITLAGMGDCRTALEESGWDIAKAVDLIKARGQAIAGSRDNKIAAEGVVKLGHFTTPTGESGSILVEVNCQTDFVANSPDFAKFAQHVAMQVSLDASRNKLFHSDSVSEKRKDLVALTKEKIDVRRWWVYESTSPLVKVFSYVHATNKIGVLLTLLAPSEEALNSKEFIELGNDLTLQIAAMSPLDVDRDSLDPVDVARQKSIFETQLTESNKPQASWEKILAGKFNKWYTEVCLLEQESIIVPKTTVGQLVKNVGAKLGGEVSVMSFVRCQVGEGIVVDKTDFADEVNQLAGVSK